MGKRPAQGVFLMKIRLRAETEKRRGGIAATALDLGLVAHGEDHEDALQRLERVALTWCFALRRADWLERALSNRGILWEPVGTGIAVELVVDSSS